MAPGQPPLGLWMVALPAVDGRAYVYRVYAPDDALRGDLFWAAFHCHDEARRPRASDEFDAAEIWRPGEAPADGESGHRPPP